MVVYGYRCRTCGRERESPSRTDNQPCPCGGLSRRQYHFTPKVNAFSPHFNHAVGQFVQSDREFDDALKRRAEENTIRTGIDHSYARVDPGDLATTPPTSDTEVLNTRERIIHDAVQE